MSNENDATKDILVKNFQVQCESCQAIIAVPIKQSDVDSAIGGVFKMVVLHQCKDDKQKAFVLFFDKHLSLRSKAISDVAVSDIQKTIPLEDQILTKEDLFSSLKLLYSKFKKEFGSIIYGLLLGQQIIIVGNQSQVEPITEALAIFAPHRQLTIRSWTEGKSSADIIGKPAISQQENSEALVVDMEKSAIINGYQNNFCSSLAQKIGEEKEAVSALESIENELERFLNYVQSYSLVNDFEEAETYFTALALDGVDQELLEIILPLSAELNPFIANFYSKDQLQISSLAYLQPSHLWYTNQGNTFQRLQLTSPEQFFFREQIIQQKIKRILDCNFSNEFLFEYITPNNIFLALIESEKTILARFPMIAKGFACFKRMMTIKQMLKSHPVREQKLLSYLKDEFDKEQENTKQIFAKFENELVAIRESRPIVAEHTLVERHFLSAMINESELKTILPKVVEEMVKKFPTLQPKVIRKEDCTIVKEIIPNLSANRNNPSERVDLGVNILFFNAPGDKNRMTLLLELYLRSSFYKIGFNYDLAFEQSYKQIMKILQKVL